MRPHRVSASKVWDMLQCAYPFRTDVELVPDVTGPAACDGNAIDELCVDWLSGGGPHVSDVCKKHGASLNRVYALWEQLRPWLDAHMDRMVPWAAQLWLAYDVSTGKARKSHRTDKKADTEISAISDFVGHIGPDYLRLDDVKTGKPLGAHVEQLLTNSVAAASFFGVSRVRSRFVFVSEHGVNIEPFEFGPDDLERHANLLHASILEVPESVPTVGNGCRWCRVKECKEGDAFRKRMKWRPLKKG